jgi:hypothetical protein
MSALVHPRAARLSWIISLCLVGSCASHLQDRDTLEKAVEELNEGVRWGRHDVAIRRLPPQLQRPYLDRVEQLGDQLAIVDFETTRVTSSDDGRAAIVRIEVQWYLQSEGVTHKTVVDERWERIDSYWMLTGSSRARGTPLATFELTPPKGRGARSGP